MIRSKAIFLALLCFSIPSITQGEVDEAVTSTPPDNHFPEQIVHPPTLGTVDTGELDIHGAPIGVACATCHSAAAGAQPLAERPGAPEVFHASVVLKHGNLKCASCHDSENRTLLHLADGETLQMAEVMQLCQQCHGPQYRDFVHGSHGGARGYWDTTRGPRIRNSCVACHAVHDPEYPLVYPAPPPRDRFLNPAQHSTETQVHD